MNDATNKNLTPAELQAVEEHKYYMSQRLNREVLIDEAIEDFLENYMPCWRCEKQQKDNRDQIREIERHKEDVSRAVGHEVDRTAVAIEWCERFARIWRSERESLERNGFCMMKVDVRNEHGLHMHPTSSLVKLVSNYDCDVYVHKDGMDYFNFFLNGKPYMNVKSILGMLKLGIAQSETLEFISTGKQAKEVLDAIERAVIDGAGE